jgi:hypothetical protein
MQMFRVGLAAPRKMNPASLSIAGREDRSSRAG